MIIEDDIYLEHYGVKGMKWGVRRQNFKASRQRSKARYAASKKRVKAGKGTDADRKRLAARRERRKYAAYLVVSAGLKFAGKVMTTPSYQDKVSKVVAYSRNSKQSVRGAQFARRLVKSTGKLPVSKLTDSDKSGVLDVGLSTWRALNG